MRTNKKFSNRVPSGASSPGPFVISVPLSLPPSRRRPTSIPVPSSIPASAPTSTSFVSDSPRNNQTIRDRTKKELHVHV